MAKRIQRKRTKGWKMPQGAVYVGSPTKWGNPFKVWSEKSLDGYMPDIAVSNFRDRIEESDYEAEQDALGVSAEITSVEIKAELRGKDLACWCSLDQPCHADVLLEIANS